MATIVSVAQSSSIVIEMKLVLIELYGLTEVVMYYCIY